MSVRWCGAVKTVTDEALGIVEYPLNHDFFHGVVGHQTNVADKFLFHSAGIYSVFSISKKEATYVGTRAATGSEQGVRPLGKERCTHVNGLKGFANGRCGQPIRKAARNRGPQRADYLTMRRK